MRLLISLSNPQFNIYRLIKRSFLLVSCICFSFFLNAQIYLPLQEGKTKNSNRFEDDVFLQLEKVNKVKSIKLITGTELYFKLKAYPDTWRIADIQQILPEHNTLIIDGNIYTLEEFSAISLPRKPFVRSLGKQLQNFGLVWSVLGGLAKLSDREFQIQTEEYIIGPAAFLVGTILRKLPRRKKYNLEKRARLRIIDLRIITPDDY